uniref:Xyloglucan endotransglucosylase/hydrolase n=1 Tax=Davidia involucrata TaxID=16924 RepID=A0A5B6YTH0_DAVIN
MASYSSLTLSQKMLIISLILLNSLLAASAGNFLKDFDIIDGHENAKILNNGQLSIATLGPGSGTAFASQKDYLFGKFDIQLKFDPKNTALVNFNYYLTTRGATPEILMNITGAERGDRFILETGFAPENKKEQRIYLWFDPRANFHTYSILWNSEQIIFYVDDTPIRVFKNLKSPDVPFPTYYPMQVSFDIWNNNVPEKKAPLTATLRNFSADACVWSSQSSRCNSLGTWRSQMLDFHGINKLKWVQRKFMIYNYCADKARFPHGPPQECSANNLA